MDLRELETYRLSDAVKFNDNLNPRLWGSDEHLLPEVRQKLLQIADDFRESLGITDLEIKDITISGSNAAYTYTPHSDIDLHLVVDLPRADASDVYRELFDAKKYQYNDQHDYKIGGYDVELYVQNANQPHVSQGIYSVLNNDWIKVPARRRPTVDDISVRSKYEDIGQRIEQAIKSGDLGRMDAMAAKIREMRQAGLETTGEFGPENLAFKILRGNGTLEKLRDARKEAKDSMMSLDERKTKKKKTRYGYGAYWFPGYHYYGGSDAATDGGGDGGGESTKEDYDPNAEPPGPEFKPEMPAGTILVNVSDVYDWYKLGQDISDLKHADPKAYGKGAPQTVLSFGSEPIEHMYKKDLDRLGMKTLDIDRRAKNKDPEAEYRMDEQQSSASILQKFTEYVCDKLGIESCPKIKIRRDPQWSQVNGTFGHYDPDNNTLEVSVAGRHMADVMRTLAHELVHHHQEEREGIPADGGETGSRFEDEANALAGRIMRDFREHHPEIFAGELDEAIQTPVSQDPRHIKQYYDFLQGKARMGRPLSKAEQQFLTSFAAVMKMKGQVAEGAVSKALLTAVFAAAASFVQAQEPTAQPQEPVTAAKILNAARWIYGASQLRSPDVKAEFAQEFHNWLRRQGGHTDQPTRLPIPDIRAAGEQPVNEATGYIPIDDREARDPRYSMAITQDIKPGEIQRQARKMGFKTDAAGVPPLLMKKLNNLLESVKTDEDCWSGYKQQGMKRKGDRQVPNCVKVSEGSGLDQTAGIGIDGESFRFNIKDLVDFAAKYPTEKVDPTQFHDQIVGREEDPAQSQSRVAKADLKYPIIVVRRKNGSLWIADGTHRAHKAILTKQPAITAKIIPVEDMSPFSVESLAEDEDLMEVEMSPSAFKKFLNSDAAKGIRAGFEAELIFRDTQHDGDGGESEPDWDMDERASSIQEIIDFFRGGDNGISARAADRLSQDLTEQFYDWVNDSFIENYFDMDRYMSWVDDNIWPEVDDEYREQARDALGDEEISDEELEKQAVQLFRDDAERDWDRSGDWYDRAREELYDEYAAEADQADWLDSSGMRYMSDVSNEWSLEWPYWTEGGGNGGEREWRDIANSLERATGLDVRVSSGYHGTRRGDYYVIEPDGSLDADDSEDYGLEIVSPPMPLPEAIEQLNKVIDWANGSGDAYTNSSTGLHMGVSLPFKGGDVDPIKLILFMGDRDLLDKFDRASNYYTRSAYERLQNKISSMKRAGPKQIAGVMELMKKNLIELADRELQRGVLGEKYVSVNPHDGYIEFRGPGGDYLSKESEIEGTLENTMLRLAYAMSIAGSPELHRKEYAKKLYKMLSGYKGAEIAKGAKDTRFQTRIETEDEDPFMRLFADYSTGYISGDELKRQWAETVLRAEQDAEQEEDIPPFIDKDYDVYDPESGNVISVFHAEDDEAAIKYFNSNFRPQNPTWKVRVHQEPKKPKAPPSRRAELAKRVTRSTRDVGEQLWRVNFHSKIKNIVARSQAEAIQKAAMIDSDFGHEDARARLADQQEIETYRMDQERIRQQNQQQRDDNQDADDVRARLDVPPGEWTGHWIVRDAEGRELTRFHGIGNSQSDANRYAARWLAQQGYRQGTLGNEAEVVPEMR